MIPAISRRRPGAVARRAVAEALGTFFLVLIGPGAVMINAHSQGAVGHVGIALAFAFVVLAMIYTLGHLSGAHINPAVTLAFWSVRRCASPIVAAAVFAALQHCFANSIIAVLVPRSAATLASDDSSAVILPFATLA